MSTYQFGSFILEVRERRLLRDGSPVSLTPKVFDTLAYLVERHGHLVGKDELLQGVWAGSSVEEGSVPRAVHVLRKALIAGDEDTERAPQYIETVPTKGYRFVAEVRNLQENDLRAELPAAEAHGEREAQPRGSTWRRRAVLAVSSLLVLMLVGLTWRDLNVPTGATPGLRRVGPSTSSGAAYARFQNGRVHLERHLPDDIEVALREFEAAIELDPTFADAYAGKADAKFFRYWITGAHDDIAQARLAIRKSIQLDGDSSYAHGLLCRLLGTYDWEFAAAESECRRAVDLDPENHEARKELSFLMSATGRHDDALREMDNAIAVAPTSFNKRSRGLLLYLHRRFDEAITQLKQVEATDPGFRDANRLLARSFEQKQDYGQAVEFLIQQRRAGGATSEQIASLRRTFEAEGWPGVLRASLPKGRGEQSLEAAGTFAQLGERDAAFSVLQSMISDRRVMVVHMNSEPRLDPLRTDPRFDQLIQRVGLR